MQNLQDVAVPPALRPDVPAAKATNQASVARNADYSTCDLAGFSFSGSAAETSPSSPTPSGNPTPGNNNSNTNAPLTAAEQRKRFDTIRGWLKYVESLTPGHQDPHDGMQHLKTQWAAVRDEAIKGNPTSLKALHGLLLEQMQQELIAPGRQLVRFNYSSFDDLRDNLKDEERFKVEVQWRALLGLRSFYFNKLDQKNDFVGSCQTLFKPVVKLLDENPQNVAIQRWGSLLLIELCPRLTGAQQQAVAQRVVDLFLASEDSAQRHFALRCIPRLYANNSKLPLWNALQAHCRTALQDQSRSDLKYFLVCSQFIGDPQLTDNIEKLDLKKMSREDQMAASWVLGRSRSDRSLALLSQIARDPGADIFAREMAIFSIAEFKTTHRGSVLPLLNQMAKDTGTPDVLRDAANAMLEKVSANVVSEPDYYIRQMPAEQRDEFRRLRAAYIKDFDQHSFSIVQKNIIDRSLIPYFDHLQKLVAAGEQHVLITHGAITQLESHRNMVGVRSFDGRLWDSIRGIGYNNGQAVTPTYDLIDGYTNTFAHEFMHHIHLKAFSKELADKVTDLYKEAVRSGKALNYYAASNDREYIAVANEAMDAIYIDHYYLYDRLFNEGFDAGSGHNRAQLKRKDRELYDLLSSLRQQAAA